MSEPKSPGEAGFTLLEAMAGVAAMGAIVAALAVMAGQWIPAWRHGFADLQRAELLGMALDRITADLTAAEFVTLDAETKVPTFIGTPVSATFVRAAIGPNASPGLEFVQIAETGDGRNSAVTRSSAPFSPGNPHPNFGNVAVLTRFPFHISFGYAGPDRHWIETWTDGGRLPDAVRVTVRDAGSGVVLAVSTAALMKVTAGPPAPEAVAAATTPAPGPPAQEGNGASASPAGPGGSP